MKLIGIIENRQKQESLRIAEEIRGYLDARGVRTAVSNDGTDLPEECECAFVLGGDGTMLSAAKAVSERQLPLLGVNLGALGYLAEIDPEQIFSAVDRLLEGQYTVEKRMMLSGRVIKKGKAVYSDTALNDIVIKGKTQLRRYSFINHVNGRDLNVLNADGLIFSTATGSTGYNLSAGGPIVSPEAEIMVMTPLASHSLVTSRSIIFSGNDRLRIVIGEGRTGHEYHAAEVQFDGKPSIDLDTGDCVEIIRSPKDASIMKIQHVNFLDILREKMAEI